jgi:hypothetical protein
MRLSPSRSGHSRQLGRAIWRALPRRAERKPEPNSRARPAATTNQGARAKRVWALHRLPELHGRMGGGAVLVLGQLFGGIGTEPPTWAVAGATLAADLLSAVDQTTQPTTASLASAIGATTGKWPGARRLGHPIRHERLHAMQFRAALSAQRECDVGAPPLKPAQGRRQRDRSSLARLDPDQARQHAHGPGSSPSEDRRYDQDCSRSGWQRRLQVLAELGTGSRLGGRPAG